MGFLIYKLHMKMNKSKSKKSTVKKDTSNKNTTDI